MSHSLRFDPLFDFEHRALTIDDVLSRDYEALPVEDRDYRLAESRMTRWISISADGNQENFQKRASRLSWSREELLNRFAGVRRRPNVVEPQWVEKARHVLALLEVATYAPCEQGLAFGSILAPVVSEAVASLFKSHPTAQQTLLHPEAVADMVTQLQMRLSNLCELPMYEGLLAWRRNLLSLAKLNREDAIDALSSDSLADFTQHLRETRFESVFGAKPILLRLIAMLVEQWHSSYGAFLFRLESDRSALSALCAKLPADSRVRHIEWGLSDPHHGGFSVLRLEFDSGDSVLYKPKDLRPDALTADVAAELMNLGCSESLRVPKVIIHADYGWAEYIEREQCDTEKEVKAYFRRFGAWLAVFHAMSSSDMHMENFIAHGAHPVPVDFEMILQGLRQRPISIDDDTEARWLASNHLEASVLSVGMLPSYIPTEDGSLISMGALEPSIYPVNRVSWQDINTPRMRLVSSSEDVRIDSNLPLLNGQTKQVNDYREEFVEGFCHTLRFLCSHGSHIAEFVREKATGIEVRRVVRPTRFYYMLIKRLNDPRNMADSVMWSLESDFVARLYDWDEGAEQPWKLAASERRQLLELGIPHFTMETTSNIISDDLGPVTRLHIDLGLDVTRQRLFSNHEVVDQEKIVRTCLQMAASSSRAYSAEAKNLTRVETIYQSLLRHSHRGSSSLAWLGLTRIDHEVAAQLATVGHDLYYGATGIAIFFAALAHVDVQGARDNCRRALGATLGLADTSQLQSVQRAIGIGGAVGTGSVVYGLTVVADLTNEDVYLSAAKKYAQAIDTAAIQADRRFDLVGGAAGACLALIELYRKAREPWILEKAVECAEHLLKCRDESTGLWLDARNPLPLTGVAHGTAGFAMAFSRLFSETRIDRYSAAANDCVDYENRYFDSKYGNWLDTRNMAESQTKRPPNQWCYGASGIGLARLAMKADDAVDAGILDRDIERALNATLSDRGGRNSSACCGDAGHIAFLSEAGRTLIRPNLLNEASQRFRALEHGLADIGDFKWNSGSSDLNPGMFQGLSGIGWIALDLVSKTPLPSILTLRSSPQYSHAN